MINQQDNGRAIEARKFPALDAAVMVALWIAVGLGQLWMFGVLFVFWATGSSSWDGHI